MQPPGRYPPTPSALPFALVLLVLLAASAALAACGPEERLRHPPGGLAERPTHAAALDAPWWRDARATDLAPDGTFPAGTRLRLLRGDGLLWLVEAPGEEVVWVPALALAPIEPAPSGEGRTGR